MDPISTSADSRAVALARRVLRIEAAAVAALADRVGEEFERAVDIILKRHGRVIVTGIGKSGHIARKIAATLAMEASASPRKPRVWMWPRSSALAILLVAWRTKALSIYSASMPLPLSAICSC